VVRGAPPDRAVGGRSRPFVVIHLLRVEIHPTARRHGVSDADAQHAVTRATAWVELDDDPPRYLVVGPARSGNLLEVVVIQLGRRELVIHAMALRRSTEREVFGATDD